MSIIKVSEEQSDATFTQIREMLEINNPEVKDYELVFATRTKTRNYIVYQKTTIYNYIIGYTNAMDKFFISSLSLNGKDNYTTTDPVFFVRDDIESFTRKMTGTINVKLKSGFKCKFSVPAYTLKSAGYTLPVSQKDRSAFFNDHVKNNPIK